MAKVLILLLAVVGGALLLKWLRRQPRATQMRWLLYSVVGAVIVLALTGRIHWLGAVFAALLVIAKKLILLFRFLPFFVGRRTQSQSENDATPMSHADALKVLDLEHGATREDIIAAHKRLMQKVHPDRGGSDHLAKQINRAKERLLKDLDP